MNDISKEEPRLVFFRERPQNMLDLPPLASSLQHLETSFLLLSIGRYPHALLSCVSSIESAIKAKFSIEQSEDIKLWKLFEMAKPLMPDCDEYDNVDLKNLREKRNIMIHYGFSLKDDDLSTHYLLKTGYPYIQNCYQAFFDFNLTGTDKEYGGLLPNFGHQLRIANRVYRKNLKDGSLSKTYCFISFAHAIRWGIQHWMLSNWQNEILEDEGESGWVSKQELKDILINRYCDIYWEFDCPVCNHPKSLICELNEDELHESNIKLERCCCIHCGLIVPADCPFLTDELCADQVEKAKPLILKEPGYT